MSDHHDAAHDDVLPDAPHSTFKGYMTGFVLAVVLTVIYFLHMNFRSQGGWNMLALIFTAVIVFITLAGSLWVMYHLNVNMMPGMMQDPWG